LSIVVILLLFYTDAGPWPRGVVVTGWSVATGSVRSIQILFIPDLISWCPKKFCFKHKRNKNFVLLKMHFPPKP